MPHCFYSNHCIQAFHYYLWTSHQSKLLRHQQPRTHYHYFQQTDQSLFSSSGSRLRGSRRLEHWRRLDSSVWQWRDRVRRQALFVGKWICPTRSEALRMDADRWVAHVTWHEAIDSANLNPFTPDSAKSNIFKFSKNRQHHRNVLLNSFPMNGHTLVFHP